MTDANTAINLAAKVQKMADDHMAKLVRDFDAMKMPHDMRAIIFGAVARKAMDLAHEAASTSELRARRTGA